MASIREQGNLAAEAHNLIVTYKMSAYFHSEKKWERNYKPSRSLDAINHDMVW